jgi:hypothetical protein
MLLTNGNYELLEWKPTTPYPKPCYGWWQTSTNDPKYITYPSTGTQRVIWVDYSKRTSTVDNACRKYMLGV